MALPTTISDQSPKYLAPASQGRMRPYISSAGSVYVVLKRLTSAIAVWKSTDPATVSFTKQAEIGQGNEVDGWGTHQDGDDLHIVTSQRGDEIRYNVFSMSSDSFTTSNEDNNINGTDIDADKACSISLETDGSIIIFYQGDSDNNMGAKERVDRAYKPSGGSWTVDQAVDDGGKVNFFLGGIVRGEANKFHLVYKDDTNSNAEHKSVQDVDGTLSSVETMGDSTDLNDFIMVSPVYYDDAGAERITAAWQKASSSVMVSSEIDDDGTPSAQEDAGDNNVTLGGAEFASASIAVDVKDVWLLYCNTTDLDVYSDVNSDSGGWGTDTEELDAVTVNLITSNVYTRANTVVLAYVYDDGGTIKYNEKFLRIAANSAFADARLPRQNYHVGPFEF